MIQKEIFQLPLVEETYSYRKKFTKKTGTPDFGKVGAMRLDMLLSKKGRIIGFR
jgi:hypothetical protein